MQIYNYHPDSGEYLRASTARKNPQELGNYLIPANATTISPPSASEGMVPVFADGEWSVDEDHRGATVYDKPTGNPVVVSFIGVIPSEYTELEPASSSDSWDGSAWITPPPSQAAVESERDRRLASAPFEYDFGDARGVHVIGTDAKDLEAWIKEVMPAAQARLALSDTTPIDIVTNTGPVSVTAMEWMAIISAGTTSRQAIWAAYFSLIFADPIPSDYTGNSHWPSAS